MSEKREYVGIAEIAEMLNLSTPRVVQIVSTYKDFPNPEGDLRMGRFWGKMDVQEWIDRHPHRPHGRPKKKAKSSTGGE